MPAKDVNKMKRERSELVVKMRAMVDTAEKRENKKFTDEESRQYNEYQTELDRRDDEIKREERLQAAELETVSPESREKNDQEFKSLGEFLIECRDNPGSTRLLKRAVTAGSGPSMGIVIPTQFDQNIRAVTPQTAIIRPRALVIPAGDPPDAPFQMVALDQGGSKGVYAGVLMKWIGENSARTGAGDPQVVLITVQPNLLQGYIDVSDMLLRNAPAMEAFLTDRMRLACIGAEDSSFFTGNGVKKPLGPIGHGSAIKVKRNTASKIKYADLVKMMASFMFGNQPVWVASQSCLEELMLMEDTEGHLIWQPSAREGMPNTLLGYPVIFSQRSPRLGSNGDLALMDFKYYCIKDGSGLAIFMDPYTQKANGLTRIYVMFMVDGQPMINSPLLSENGVDKISPFVTLE